MLDWWFVVVLLAVAGFALLAYALRVLDAQGAAASGILGAVVAFAGGLGWLVLMAVFTGIAYLATRAGKARKRSLGTQEPRDGERGLGNVVGNGAAPALAALAATFMDPLAAKLAFAAAVATIAADTLASEVGALAGRARLVTPPWPPRPAGSNGAVSWLGQASALAGAAAIGVAAAFLLDFPLILALVPAVAGFVGSQVDSFLGATLERDFFHPERPLSKQDVNFLASLMPALVVLLAVQWSTA